MPNNNIRCSGHREKKGVCGGWRGIRHARVLVPIWRSLRYLSTAVSPMPNGGEIKTAEKGAKSIAQLLFKEEHYSSCYMKYFPITMRGVHARLQCRQIPQAGNVWKHCLSQAQLHTKQHRNEELNYFSNSNTCDQFHKTKIKNVIIGEHFREGNLDTLPNVQEYR